MLFRILSSAVVIPILIFSMFQFPQGFRFFMLAALMLGYEEYRRMMALRGLRFAPWRGLLVLALVLLPVILGSAWTSQAERLPLASIDVKFWLAIFFVAAALQRVFRPDLENGLPRFNAELAGLFYIGLLGYHFISLDTLSYGPWWVMLVFWYAWSYDSGALFVGKSMGRRPFNPLSPSKTWEGFWGGIVFNALLSGLVLPHVFPAGFPLSGWGFALFSVPASVLAQTGDLFESMLKRYAGVKDSSHIIATHGGFLDKMDSSLFVAPLLYLVATLLKP